ncbi:MAG: YdiU family protein [Rhodoferax sp.]|jgi:uncharacterized protein YdiU (UPF0061 family)|nr:YdiU family protein [Rhodoferax sp.]MBP7492535.1 YdiU family protein [Rhodoferax sp.]
MNNATLQLQLDNSYARELEGCYVPWQPAGSPNARLIKLNQALALELGLTPALFSAEEALGAFSGNVVPPTAQPLAQAYAGHQFGHFSPQLGDGRAVLLGERIDQNGQRRDIALKGSGRTPFSRSGDGLATLGPVLREYLMGEAMHALGIPTTRGLAVVSTGESVQRERELPGAVLTRVAASHLRIGTFEFFASRGDTATLRRLADYAIARHDLSLVGAPDRYLGLLKAVAERQALLVARWMGVGFVHGVMNTDNMTISGETIDYGPCAFIEHLDPKAVFSSIDRHARYAFGNQPPIAQWNIARLAQALLPLIDDDEARAGELAADVVNGFADRFEQHWQRVLHAKLALPDQTPEDSMLGNDYLQLLQTHRIDYTLGFRRLMDAATGDDAPLQALFGQAQPQLTAWLERWRQRTGAREDTVAKLRAVNPLYIARNHQVEAALAAAVDEADFAPFERLLAVLQHPFDEREEDQAFSRPAPAEQTACYKTFCGT